jgi:hypothetical protein
MAVTCCWIDSYLFSSRSRAIPVDFCCTDQLSALDCYSNGKCPTQRVRVLAGCREPKCLNLGAVNSDGFYSIEVLRMVVPIWRNIIFVGAITLHEGSIFFMSGVRHLTVNEAAGKAACKASHIRREVMNGKIKVVRVGQRIFLNPESFQQRLTQYAVARYKNPAPPVF